jgi:predicted DNA-binding protein
MAKDNKTETVGIRMTKELRDKLQAMADKDSRSLSDYIHIQLEKIAKIGK